jgi:hypothetical protein
MSRPIGVDFIKKLYIYYHLKEEWNQSKEGKKSPEFWCGKWVKDKRENAGVS